MDSDISTYVEATKASCWAHPAWECEEVYAAKEVNRIIVDVHTTRNHEDRVQVGSEFKEHFAGLDWVSRAYWPFLGFAKDGVTYDK